MVGSHQMESSSEPLGVIHGNQLVIRIGWVFGNEACVLVMYLNHFIVDNNTLLLIRPNSFGKLFE
jgi:hypothetical protein